MKTILYVIFPFVFIPTLVGQTIDTAYLRVTYNFSYMADSTKELKKTDIEMLQVGKTYTRFFSYTKYQRDSAIYAKMRESPDVNGLLGNWNQLQTDGLQGVYFQKLNTDSCIMKNEIGRDKYIVDEKIEYVWKIKGEDKKIQGYNC